MPIYEFYCIACNGIFNFFSKTVNTHKFPNCPKCGLGEMTKIVSSFSAPTGKKGTNDSEFPDIEENRLEKAIGYLAEKADKINEGDSREAADLMRKFSDMTGVNLGEKMSDALDRLEAGDDPDQIEADMGDIDGEELFSINRRTGEPVKKNSPLRDDTLYEL